MTLVCASYFLLYRLIRVLRSSILSLVALSFAGREEAVGPRGFFARIECISVWMTDFSDSRFLTVWVDFWRTRNPSVTFRHMSVTKHNKTDRTKQGEDNIWKTNNKFGMGCFSCKPHAPAASSPGLLQGYGCQEAFGAVSGFAFHMDPRLCWYLLIHQMTLQLWDPQEHFVQWLRRRKDSKFTLKI